MWMRWEHRCLFSLLLCFFFSCVACMRLNLTRYGSADAVAFVLSVTPPGSSQRHDHGLINVSVCFFFPPRCYFYEIWSTAAACRHVRSLTACQHGRSTGSLTTCTSKCRRKTETKEWNDKHTKNQKEKRNLWKLLRK